MSTNPIVTDLTDHYVVGQDDGTQPGRAVAARVRDASQVRV